MKKLYNFRLSCSFEFSLDFGEEDIEKDLTHGKENLRPTAEALSRARRDIESFIEKAHDVQNLDISVDGLEQVDEMEE
jgi:hypothetical protein